MRTTSAKVIMNSKSQDLFDIFRQKWKKLECGDGKYNSFKKGLEGLLKMELEDLAWEKTPIGVDALFETKFGTNLKPDNVTIYICLKMACVQIKHLKHNDVEKSEKYYRKGIQLILAAVSKGDKIILYKQFHEIFVVT